MCSQSALLAVAISWPDSQNACTTLPHHALVVVALRVSAALGDRIPCGQTRAFQATRAPSSALYGPCRSGLNGRPHNAKKGAAKSALKKGFAPGLNPNLAWITQPAVDNMIIDALPALGGLPWGMIPAVLLRAKGLP